MADANKDTIYIDIDDEITAIIDKLRASSGKVVALVLPKRATTLQSIVNMKLLKRAADESKKHLVLVTTESGLLPLAGAVGVHVAKTPSSRPEIPAAPVVGGADETIDEADDLFVDEAADRPLTAENAGNRPVGELAGATMPLPTRPATPTGIETLELDNEDKAAAVTPLAAAAKPIKPKRDKKLRVPDFDRFRTLLVLGAIMLVLLIFLGYLALVVLPKATIAIKTNASNVNTNVDFSLSTAASTLNEKTNTVPAKQVQVQKTYTGTANATGQKNNGDKATGSITITAQECGANALNDPSLSAGSGVSANSLTYVTQENAKFGSPSKSGNCFVYKSSAVSIKAQNGGAKYNTGSGTSFSVSGHPDFSSITGSASGGTDDIQTVVSQGDIDSAKAKIAASDNEVQGDLKGQLEGQGLYAITTTFVTGTPATTLSANPGDQASGVTVTEMITYTMLGANEQDLKRIVDNDIKSQIDTSLQGILSEGITQAAFKVRQTNDGGAAMNLQTVAAVGPSINTDDIAANAVGKKAGDIRAAIKANPDVTDVTVKLSPFWVSKAPKNVNKITVTVAKPSKTANAQ